MRIFTKSSLVLSLLAPLAILAVGCGAPSSVSNSESSPTSNSESSSTSNFAATPSIHPEALKAANSVASSVPASAIVDSGIQALTTWEENHDPGTGASSSSSGSMFMVGSPSLSGDAREFDTSFKGSGGEIYHVRFGADTTSTNFFYDAEVYLTSSAGTIANLEMDMNQVMPNGDTVIYGFQCDGYSGTWDFTENAGSPSSPKDKWVHSKAACNVRKWSRETWHHIQVSYSRNDSGDVTYNAVWLDGVESKIGVTVPSAFALHWGPTLLTNFQIDGLGSGSNTVYLDKLKISRW